MDRECFASFEDDQNLSAHYDRLDANEPVVFEDALKNVEPIIEASTAARTYKCNPSQELMDDLLVLVEDLHPNESIKYEGL